MANVNIKFNGKDFLLSCDDGQEEHLEELANHLGSKFEKLKADLGNIGENKLLLITSIKIMDEYFETKKKVHTNKQEIINITKKFKELKSLAIKYKDFKEVEINDLNREIENIKKSIDEVNIMYENMLDKTTKSLEKIIENAETSSNIQ